MSERDHSKERSSGRTRRRTPTSPRTSRSPTPKRSSRSPPRRSKRSPRRSGNEIHRENPIPSAVLGVFGLSQYTTESDLKDLFYKFGRVKDIQIVIDKKTNRSRGFGFIYFEEVENATRAKEALNSTELDHHRLRIDYSTTRRAHTPTPGIYMGVRTSSYRSNGHNYRRSPSADRRSHRRHRRSTRSRSRTRSRTRSRSRSRSHRRERRRSPAYAYD